MMRCSVDLSCLCHPPLELMLSRFTLLIRRSTCTIYPILGLGSKGYELKRQRLGGITVCCRPFHHIRRFTQKNSVVVDPAKQHLYTIGRKSALTQTRGRDQSQCKGNIHLSAYVLALYDTNLAASRHSENIKHCSLPAASKDTHLNKKSTMHLKPAFKSLFQSQQPNSPTDQTGHINMPSKKSASST